MAWTTTKVAQYNAGGTVVQHWTLLADSATLELSTGLKKLDVVHVTAKSLTALVKTKINVLSTAVASYGNLAITGATSGDELYLTVYGN